MVELARRKPAPPEQHRWTAGQCLPRGTLFVGQPPLLPGEEHTRWRGIPVRLERAEGRPPPRRPSHPVLHAVQILMKTLIGAAWAIALLLPQPAGAQARFTVGYHADARPF